MVLVCLTMLTGNMVFFVLIRTGVNKRFEDPSLTIAQMVVALFWVGVLSYLATSELRGSIIALFLVIFFFGVFRLSLRVFFFLVAVAVAVYVASILLLYRNQPDAVDLYLEAVRCAILMATLIWFSLLGNYIYQLRQKMSRTNADLSKALETIKQLAIHDELTDVYNRRHMFSILAQEKAFADRASHTFTICLIDLDDFKVVNDTYGHLAGDELLKTFASVVKGNIRREDYVARYGGEEFLVVFKGPSNEASSLESAQRLQALTEVLTFTGKLSSVKITISIGMTTYQQGEPIEAILSRADEALYMAKDSGKNKVVYIPPSEAQEETS
jgi:diguanylate cyclase (GGDEF)-like protein